MISFINDYSEGAHPRIMQMLTEANYEQNTGYGEDIHSEKAKEYIKQGIQNKDIDIHFIPGGTQTNLLVISSFLRPHQCVIAADTGHINVHEAGAIEATGHKVIGIPVADGKLTPEAIQQVLDYHTDEHMVQPKLVYISDTTEVGTVYTKGELTAIHDLCRKKGLLLYMDGARLASALTSKENNMELNDIAELTDVFYIGGTKNGALLGEALVICNKDLKEDFRHLMKQRGAMMAKGFVIGMQFEALFQDRLFYELGQYANKMAEKIADILTKKGYSFYTPPCSNQLFPILSKEKIAQLSEKYQFIIMNEIDENHSVIRLVTSWATTKESVEELCRDL